MKFWLYFICTFCLVACRQPSVAEIKEYPLMPMQLFVEQGAIQLRRAPMHTYDRKYRSVTYTPDGEITAANFETVLFPTDVIAVYLEGMESPQVFLARSPHSGCILQYVGQANVFSDPCYGSTFAMDGTYMAGPAQQDLDQLPSEVRDEMLWIRNEIIYGTVRSVGRDR
jgi:Rieske Fe-S protein